MANEMKTDKVNAAQVPGTQTSETEAAYGLKDVGLNDEIASQRSDFEDSDYPYAKKLMRLSYSHIPS